MKLFVKILGGGFLLLLLLSLSFSVQAEETTTTDENPDEYEEITISV